MRTSCDKVNYSLANRAPVSAAMILGTFLLLLVFLSSFPNCQAQEECTVTLVRGSATPDGRPLLMKSRDVSNPAQEFVYSDAGTYAYISVTYSGTTNQVWGGANEVGFAIQNANAWNFPDEVPGPDDDGYIILEALSTCLTVDDFQQIMDSTNNTGRTRPAVYGVIDAFGDGAFFEAASYEYDRYDLDDSTAAPNGYMVRANFAYSGSSYHLGQHRHDRALALMDSAYAGGVLTHEFLFQVVLRDLVNEVVNPYPLPFRGYDRTLPYGLLHTHDSINREITQSAYIVQGILPGENPLLSTIWAMAGEPTVSVALPLWVHAGSVPVEFDGPNGSLLNLKARTFRSYVYFEEWAQDAIDTWRLLDERGYGLLPLLLSLENQAFSLADSALAIWRTQGIPASDIVEELQNSIAVESYAALDAWSPPQAPEITALWLGSDQIQLNWSPVNQDVFGRPLTVSAYSIYASTQPFYNREAEDSLTTTSSPPIIITTPEEYRFFQIRCQP
ncbi:MAG: hypothetical protein ABH878_04025 [bacterium]